MQIFLSILYILFIIVQVIVALYILVPFFSLVSHFLLNLFRVKGPYERKPFLTDKDFEFGFIITAHQEPEFILPLVDSILKQEYQKFRIYVVADDCDLTGIHFTDERITVLQPEVALHSKIKSIRHALAHFKTKPDAVIILDSDNLIHPSFLQVMNNHFRKGYRVVQSDFKPKNTDTLYARMDAIGDMYNFFIDREIRMRWGLSSSIWGSGVAIDTDMYNEIQYSSFLGGFDKKMQAYLVQRVPRMAFAPEAILYDEKITNGKSLEVQRTRWISSYFTYIKDSLAIFWNGIKKLDFNLIYFGFITLCPPLFITLGLGFAIMVINFFVSTTAFITWFVILALFVLSFIGIVAVKGKDPKYLQALFSMPFFVLRQVAALLKIKKAKGSFLKTEHSKVIFIDELLKNRTV